MYKNLFIVCLLLALTTSVTYLTPSYPPTAYQNQFYSVRFRVRGLDNPIFSYEGLPKSLSGNPNGVLSGIPVIAGSFSIVIKYRDGAEFGSKQVLLKVLEDYRTSQSIVKSTATRVGLVIEYPGSFIFRVGQTIRIPFTAKNAVGGLIWSFQGLPTGIKGNAAQGVVEGIVPNAGYYNLQVQCADGEGKSAQAFVTINVQPQVTLTTTKIVDVNKAQSSSLLSTYDKIQKEQVAADNELFKALDVVDTKKKVVADVKQHVATATLRVTNAQLSYDAADATLKQATSDRDTAQAVLASSLNALNAAQKNLELALTEQGQSTQNLANARKALEEAQKRFNDAQKVVSEAEAALVVAKAAFSKAQQQLRTASTQKATAQQQYKRAFEALESARTQLEDAKARKHVADQAVKAAQDALELALQARDDAENDLKKADFNLEKNEKALDAALKKVAAIRQKRNAADKELQAAQWEWDLALNKLYVAQARKETADRASAIALAEGSLSDHNVNNGVNTIGQNKTIAGSAAGVSFGGCDAKAYPVISGTSKVVSLLPNGYTLSSGQQVIYGSCSTAGKCAVGDFVKYNGYIVNGVVNALRIERVLYS